MYNKNLSSVCNNPGCIFPGPKIQLHFYEPTVFRINFNSVFCNFYSFRELLEKFGLSTNESEKVTLHLNIDGKDTKVVIDYGKVNLYDEVELEIERKAGSTLGKYILSSAEVKAPSNNGGTTGGTAKQCGFFFFFTAFCKKIFCL